MAVKSSRRSMKVIGSRAPKYQNLMFGDYLKRIGVEKSELWSNNPWPALGFILRYHAFARAGGEQAGYGALAYSALDSLSDSSTDRVSSTELWFNFQDQCKVHGIGVNEQSNRGVVIGLSELANREGNLFLWMNKVVDSTGELRPIFEDLVSCKGIGRKIATFIIRDVIWFLGHEDHVNSDDLKFLHPIDRWVRRVAERLIPGVRNAKREQIATILAEECDRHGISNAEFNQGAWYFSRVELEGEINRIESKIQSASLSQVSA